MAIAVTHAARMRVLEPRPENSKEVEFHKGIRCGGCNVVPIVGGRFRSLERENYDLCENCWSHTNRDTTCWTRVKSNLLGNVISHAARDSVGDPVHHRIFCNRCGMFPLIGRRFKCANVPDFDLCQACHEWWQQCPESNTRRFDEITISMTTVAKRPSRAAHNAVDNCNGSQVHAGFICDGCSMKPIVGGRYRSLTMHDFDLCEKCWAHTDQDSSCWVHIQTSTVEVHQGIMCDGCNLFPIVGGRYKSLERESYDLCEKCWGCTVHDPSHWIRINPVALTPGVAPPPIKVETRHIDESSISPVSIITLGDESVVEHATKTEATTQKEVVFSSEVPRPEARNDVLFEAASFFDASAVQLDAMDGENCRAAIAVLLQHPDVVVRLAATTAVAEAVSTTVDLADVSDLAEPKVKEKAGQTDCQPSSGASSNSHKSADSIYLNLLGGDVVIGTKGLCELALEDMVSTSDDPAIVEEVSEPSVTSCEVAEAPTTVPAASALVVSSAPLILGIEAEQDGWGHGDVTERFAEVVTSSGARQAFSIGRVWIRAAVDAAPVPVCARISVANDGGVPWPESTAVTLAAGDELGFQQLLLGSMQPGEEVDVVMDLLVPARAEPSSVRSAWAVVDTATGTPLGPLIFFEAMWFEG